MGEKPGNGAALSIAGGLAVSLAVVTDPWIRAALLRLGMDEWIPHPYPYVGTALVVLAALGGATLWALRGSLFGLRDRGLIAALFVPLLFTGFNLGGLDPTDIALAAVAYVWLISTLVERRPLVLPRPYLLLLVLLASFGLASVVNGLLPALLTQHSLVSKLVLFVLVMNIVRSRPELLGACRLVVWLGVVVAVLALAQVLLYALTGIPLTLVDLTEVMFKGGAMLRASALFPTCQVMAHFLSFATALNLFLTPARVWRVLAALLMGAAVALTWSLGAWIVWTLTLVASPIVARPRLALRYVAMLAIGAAAVLPAAAGAGFDLQLLRSVGQDSAGDRTALLQAGVEMIRRHPILGYGLANHGRVIPVPVHNAYVQMASEIGVAGGLVFTALVALVIARLLGAVAAHRDDSGGALARGLFLGTLAMAAHFMTEPFANNVISWTFLGLAATGPLVLRKGDRGLDQVQGG